MKRMWSVLGAGLIVGMAVTLLLSCNPSIDGELTLLVEKLDHESGFSHSPCWSSDATKVYYLSHWGNGEEYSSNYVIRSIDLSDHSTRKVLDNNYDIGWMDVSHVSDICVTYSLDKLEEWLLYDLENSTLVDSINCSAQKQKFSLESDQIIYYSANDGIHKFNLADSSDEIFWTRGSGSDFAPGPGDTLFARGDTVFNINTGEAIPIGIAKVDMHCMNWNPAVAEELVLTTVRDLHIFNLETEQLHRLDIRDVNVTHLEDAKFSPDGKRIIFSCSVGRDLQRDEIWMFEPED